MKKAIIVIALVIVCFIPTYILVFQAARTAVPDGTLDTVVLEPDYVRWRLTGGEGDVSEVQPNTDSAKHKFDKKDPVLLTQISDLTRLNWTPAPVKVTVYVIDLNTKIMSGPYALTDLPSDDAFDPTHHLQVVVNADWQFTKNVTARAAYGFEVKP